MGLTPAPAPMAPWFTEANRWNGLEFAWGRTDCMTVLGDWVARVTGIDPAAPIRGRYHDAASCEAVTGWLTRPVETAACYLDPLLARIPPEDRTPGDIAVLMSLGQAHGGLWLGRSWITVAPFRGEPSRGATELRRTAVLACWRVPVERLTA